MNCFQHSIYRDSEGHTFLCHFHHLTRLPLGQPVDQQYGELMSPDQPVKSVELH